MGLLDKLKGVFGQQADKADTATDRGAEADDDKTSGQYTGPTDEGADTARSSIDELRDDEGGTQT
jgi:hypothetical protein